MSFSFFLGSCSHDVIQRVQQYSVNPTHTGWTGAELSNIPDYQTVPIPT